MTTHERNHMNVSWLWNIVSSILEFHSQLIMSSVYFFTLGLYSGWKGLWWLPSAAIHTHNSLGWWNPYPQNVYTHTPHLRSVLREVGFNRRPLPRLQQPSQTVLNFSDVSLWLQQVLFLLDPSVPPHQTLLCPPPPIRPCCAPPYPPLAHPSSPQNG